MKLETALARVVFDAAKQSPEKLAAAIDRLGYETAVLAVEEAPGDAAPATR